MYHGNPKLTDSYYGEWEIGTYYCAWRVVKDGRILCGSDDSVESADELNTLLKQIEFGAIQSIEQVGSLDIHVGFDTGIMIDFLASTSDGSDSDECLGIIHGPTHRAAEFTVNNGWRIGASNSSWQR